MRATSSTVIPQRYNQQEMDPRGLMEQCFAFEILPESEAGGRE